MQSSSPWEPVEAPLAQRFFASRAHPVLVREGHGERGGSPRAQNALASRAMRKEDQDRIRVELRSRMVARVAEGATTRGGRLDERLAESVFTERQRLSHEPDGKRKKNDQLFWGRVESKMRRASDSVLLSLIGDAVNHYADEISGNFDERVYQAVTRAGVPALGLLLNAVSPKRLVSQMPALPQLDQAVLLRGELEQLRRLHELGTVILVPTHVSNLDSIVIGFALYKLGLPPFLYGAGLNLFSNPLVGYFMHNLGAYTVDRRKRDPLYKDVLKEYATLTLEHGYDNIFFPGGTRSRSGAIERKLKLGLLGTGIHAFVHNLQRRVANPKIFVVPASLSYQLVLEAETLIDDFLQEVGKSRYIISDDEFSKPTRVFDFVRQLFSLDSKIYFTVGRALDPFGNPVDDEGNSLDPQGRIIDPTHYVLQDGAPLLDAQRDGEYTQELGAQLTAAYAADNLIQSTHVTACAVLGLLRRQNPEVELLRVLRTHLPKEDVDMRTLYEEVDRLMQELRGLAARGGIRLGPIISDAAAEDIVQDGLKHFAIYHAQPAAVRRGDRVFPRDRALLFYYANRLEGYRLERGIALTPALTRDHRALRGGR